MAVNLASKYSANVDERFKLKSFTEGLTHEEYDFDGVNTINVYSMGTAPMGTYTRTGLSRFGTPSELDDTVATYVLNRDRSFTMTIDKGNLKDSMGVRESGKALARQLDEVVIPEIDIYRLTTWDAGAVANGGVPTATNITSANAYSSFLTAQAYLDNNKVPVEGRFAFVSPSYYNFIKLDPSFTKNSDLAYTDLRTGQVGDIDGVRVIKVPSSYLPAKTPFIIAHRSTQLAASKIKDYKIHQDPPGINGVLIEGRLLYGSWIMDAKKKGVYSWKEV
jgi:N4-gp56 family major capsid protein